MNYWKFNSYLVKYVFTIQFKDEDSVINTNYQETGIISATSGLLMGCLMYAYMYLKDDNRVALYREKYLELK